MFLDNISDADLRTVNLNRELILRGNFTDNNFFNEIMSGGRRNIMDATISGLCGFMEYTFSENVWSTVVIDYVKRYIKEHGKADFGDVTFYIDKDFRDNDSLRFKYNSSYHNPRDKYGDKPNCSILGRSDLAILGGYTWENFEFCKYDVNLQFIKNYYKGYCDFVLNQLLIHYHTRMHDRGKHNHSHEVLLRQCSAAFFAILTARNMMYWDNDPNEMIMYKWKGKRNWDMAFVVEYLANVTNGTKFDYAGACYTPSVQQKHYEGDVSVAYAVASAVTGRSLSPNSVSKIEKTKSFMSEKLNQEKEDDLFSF